MKVYIASKYITHQVLNRQIFNELSNAGIAAFLPETINIDAISDDEMLAVAEICYSEIEKCDVILVVCPFGQSVACELGYAIAIRKLHQKKVSIVALNSDIQNEAMIYPYIDKTVGDISQLIKYLKSISDESKYCSDIESY